MARVPKAMHKTWRSKVCDYKKLRAVSYELPSCSIIRSSQFIAFI